MSASAPTCASLSIDIEGTLHLLEELEEIKARSSYCRNQAYQAHEMGDDFYSARTVRLNLRRNELVTALESLVSRAAHPFVKERFSDTSRELFRLCQTLDNKGSVSIKGGFLLGTVALASKLPFGMFDAFLGEKIGEPTKFEFEKPPAATPSTLSWIVTKYDSAASLQALTVAPLPEIPTLDLMPKKDLTPLFGAIREYWKIVKPILHNNVVCLLKGKVRLSLVLKYTELNGSENWTPHLNTLRDIEKSLPELMNLRLLIIRVTDIFFNATNDWTTISKLYGAGEDTVKEAETIAAFDNRCYLKLASMKIRLLSLSTLIEDRAKRYKEELDKP